jgi:hypothetical protein
MFQAGVDQTSVPTLHKTAYRNEETVTLQQEAQFQMAFQVQ